MKRDIDILNEILHALHPDQPKLTPSFRSSLSIIKLLFEIFIAVFEVVFFRFALGYLLFVGPLLASGYLTYRNFPFNFYLIYFIILFIVICVILYGMKRDGAKEFWDRWTYLTIYRYLGKTLGDIFMAGFVYMGIFMCITIVLLMLGVVLGLI